MEVPQPVLKAVAVALSIGILIELVVLANISSWYRENRMGWEPDTGRPVADDDDDDDGQARQESAPPQRDTRMPPSLRPPLGQPSDTLRYIAHMRRDTNDISRRGGSTCQRKTPEFLDR
ncbi:hypothetical protein CTA2_3764 [Colletotrichum tanaceti]|uniref:Uncharacterized protein n=1 Tax=Colletotrichum tanaceti TaxID=1306861 RepID=A0A4U6X3D2_9PEZI|nr:hypothetical protein CTA2_3764 [Colletotrichum tanaceti]TKW49514.1 hypothetical protein CTA1_3671 [Colletotrichum tanaceti]